MWMLLPLFVIFWPLTLLDLMIGDFKDLFTKITDFFKF